MYNSQRTSQKAYYVDRSVLFFTKLNFPVSIPQPKPWPASTVTAVVLGRLSGVDFYRKHEFDRFFHLSTGAKCVSRITVVVVAARAVNQLDLQSDELFKA